MTYQDYHCLKINVDRRVAFTTIDHPPFNLMDMPLIQELERCSLHSVIPGSILYRNRGAIYP